MFNNARKFISLWSGAFFGNLLPLVLNKNQIEREDDSFSRSAGKGKGRRSPAPKNAAIQKRASKKRKGVAINKARHAG